MDRVEGVADPEAVVRSILDTLWQSFDIEGCGFYNADGAWLPHN